MQYAILCYKDEATTSAWSQAEDDAVMARLAQGAFLLALGRTGEARIAFDRAVALARSPAEAAHIRQHLDRALRDIALAQA